MIDLEEAELRLCALLAEVDLLRLKVEQHPTDFASQIKLSKLMKQYGIELNEHQEASFRAIGL